ncbi:MAG: LLM class flavin-dependent oxidoreductase [Actinomycetota bacterium]|nr:LLM class flavin-dependent oxidoreductase [Actinomycetota bacterium]
MRAVLGAIAASTNTLRAGTAVTCPSQRIHPVLVVQAAATAAELFDGPFFLGLGSGENLNEHIVREHWLSPNSAGRCSSRLLGDGNRLFDQMGPEPIELADRTGKHEGDRVPVVTHFRFRFVK